MSFFGVDSFKVGIELDSLKCYTDTNLLGIRVIHFTTRTRLPDPIEYEEGQEVLRGSMRVLIVYFVGRVKEVFELYETQENQHNQNHIQEE